MSTRRALVSSVVLSNVANDRRADPAWRQPLDLTSRLHGSSLADLDADVEVVPSPIVRLDQREVNGDRELGELIVNEGDRVAGIARHAARKRHSYRLRGHSSPSVVQRYARNATASRRVAQ